MDESCTVIDQEFQRIQFPAKGIPLLATCLRGALRRPLRHPPLGDGERETAAGDLGVEFWTDHTLSDARLVTRALVAQFNVGDPRRQVEREWLARLRVPFAADLESLSELKLSRPLYIALQVYGLLDPHKLSALTALDLITLQSTMRIRHVLELFSVLEVADAMPVPSDAPDEFPGMRIFPSSEQARAVLKNIASRLGPLDVQFTDARFADLLSLLPTRQVTLLRTITELRDGIRRAGNRDPWPPVQAALDAIERRLAALWDSNLEEQLKDGLGVVLGGTRHVERLTLRLGWADGRQKTLGETAEVFGVTKEVIRRHEATLRMRLGQRATLLCPKLLETMQIVQAMAPCSGEEIARALRQRGLTTIEWRLSTLVATAELIGVPHKLNVIQLGEEEHLAGVSGTDLPARIRASASERIRSAGACAVGEVASQISEDLKQFVSQDEVTRLVSAMPDARWLNEERHWFWFGEQAQHRVFRTIRRLLAVAGSLSIDEICEALLRGVGTENLRPAPKTAVLALVRSVTWLCVRQWSRVSAVEPLDWRVELSPTERILYEVLHDADDALDRISLKERCQVRGMPAATLDVCLDSSPIVRRIRPRIWGLRGVDPPPQRLVELALIVEAQHAKSVRGALERALTGLPSDARLDANKYVRAFGMTASMFKHHVITLARAVQVQPGTRFQVQLAGQQVGEVELQPDRRLRGLLPLLRQAGARVGQRYIACFNLQTRTLELDLDRDGGEDD